MATAGATRVAGQSSYLSQYNLIVLNDLQSASEIQGTVVANTITAANAFNVGINLSNQTPAATNLYVQTSIAGPLTVQSGDFYYAGAQAVVQNANQWTVGGYNVTLNQNTAAVVKPGAGPFSFSNVFNGVTANAGSYAGLTANSSAATSGNTLTFTVGSSLPSSGGTAVFSINETTLANGSLSTVSLALNGKNPDSIIVNVVGTNGYSLSTPGGMNLDSSWQGASTISKVLWNFGTTSSTVAFNTSWYGAVLAPDSTVSSTSGAMNGSMAVLNLNANGEVHLPTWTGVPEPSTYGAGVVVAVLAGVGLVRRRRG